MATFFVNSSSVGVDLNNTTTGAQFGLGTVVKGSNNSEWVYGIATAALTTGMIVGILTAGTAVALSQASASQTAQMIGVANGAFAAGEYGWFCTRGVGVTVAISASGTLNAVLYVASSTPGYISTTAGTATLAGVEILAAATTASQTTTTAILTWPRALGTGLG